MQMDFSGYFSGKFTWDIEAFLLSAAFAVFRACLRIFQPLVYQLGIGQHTKQTLCLKRLRHWLRHRSFTVFKYRRGTGRPARVSIRNSCSPPRWWLLDSTFHGEWRLIKVTSVFSITPPVRHRTQKWRGSRRYKDFPRVFHNFIADWQVDTTTEKLSRRQDFFKHRRKCSLVVFSSMFENAKDKTTRFSTS